MRTQTENWWVAKSRLSQAWESIRMCDGPEAVSIEGDLERLIDRVHGMAMYVDTHGNALDSEGVSYHA